MKESDNKIFNNSTNSLYITESPSAPDERELTKCVAKAVKVLIKGAALGKEWGECGTITERLFVAPTEGKGAIFDERVHPLRKDISANPSEEDIYQFLRLIYKRTRMQPECVVMMMSYIERIIGHEEVNMT
jgi:hypothetical protein